jgi:hypothetical protein
MRWGAILVCLVVALHADRASAQARFGGDSPSPRVAPEHWAVEAALRGVERGWIRGFEPGRGAVTVCAVSAAFQEAARTAQEPGEVALTAWWGDRLRGEFPRLDCAGDRGPALTRLSTRVLADGWTGRAAPGLGDHPPERTGLIELEDATGLAGSLAGAVRAGPLSLSVEPVAGSSGVELLGDLELFVGPLAIAAGRQPVRYGAARGGSVVMGGSVPLQRVQLETPVPLVLPGPGRWLGAVSAHTFVSRLTEGRHAPERPWLWGGSGSIRPHERFTVSIHRAAMFAPVTSDIPLSAENVIRMLVGLHTAEFEDQIVSVEGRLRFPSEGVLPLTAYLEWGAEDGAGAWWDVPGQIVGLSAPVFPGLPGLSLGVEAARFGGSCCGNPKWYRHVAYPGSWAAGDEPLAHPLGGEGRELLLYGRLEAPRLRTVGGGRLFVRERGDDNLFVPGREGISRGLGLDVAWRPGRLGEIGAELAVETGFGWTETRLRAYTHFSF